VRLRQGEALEDGGEVGGAVVGGDADVEDVRLGATPA
jgi:hypothetical protein